MHTTLLATQLVVLGRPAFLSACDGRGNIREGEVRKCEANAERPRAKLYDRPKQAMRHMICSGFLW